MITVFALLAGGALLVALGAATVRDVFRQTGAWSARHGATPRATTRQTVQHRWSALDDVQIARLLQHPAVRSEAGHGAALSSEE
jgi:hypothetical protein